MNNIIFLDIDGTMIPTSFSKYMEQMSLISKKNILSKDDFGEFFAPHCVENLRVLIEKTQGKIVFSSKWKDQGFDFLKNMWKIRYPFGELMGCTPDILNSKRGEEIETWLQNNEWDNYVILDDMTTMCFKLHHISHLVTCDEMFGFTKKDLNKALNILK